PIGRNNIPPRLLSGFSSNKEVSATQDKVAVCVARRPGPTRNRHPPARTVTNHFPNFIPRTKHPPVHQRKKAAQHHSRYRHGGLLAELSTKSRRSQPLNGSGDRVGC